MILLSDANILMDLGHVGGLSILMQLAPVEVLDVVLRECEHHSQPGLVDEIINSGIKTIAAQMDWISQIALDPKGQLSAQDTLNLYYANKFNRVLLTNEKRLRIICEEREIEVHGTLWIIKEAHERKLEKPETLCDWLDRLSTLSRRLPPEAMVSLRSILGCF